MISFADRITGPHPRCHERPLHFLRVEACCQEIANNLFAVAAVVIDVYRQKNRKKA
ncbi:hypothetical protein LJR257_004793 [Ensifer adhaerens]